MEKSLPFDQLCRIALKRYTRESYSAWEHRIITVLCEQGYPYDKTTIAAAMRAVAHQHKLGFQRPTPPPPRPVTPDYRELSPGQATAALEQVFAEVRRRFPTTPIARPRGFN